MGRGVAQFVQRSGSYIIRGPGQIYAGWAENLFAAQRWTRLLQGREEEIRRAMHAGRRDEVHAILERVEAEARGVGEERGDARKAVG